MLRSQRGKDGLTQTVRELQTVSNAIGFNYIPAGSSQRAFFAEITALITHITRETDIHCLSLDGGIKILQEEIKYLRDQEFQLITGRMVQYAAVEKEISYRRAKLILKQVGFVGSGSQIFGGAGICVASLGSLCAAFGAPLLAHGLNSTYENGYYLLYRKDKSGYTRQAYRAVAGKLGYSNNQADIAYSVVDVGLSGYGMLRPVVRSDSFRLFRHLDMDYIQAWKEMGSIPLFSESVGNSYTLYSIYQLKGGIDVH